MAQTYATINTGTQTGAVVFGHLADRTDTLRSNFSGGTVPTSPVEGQLTEHTGGSASGYDMLKVYHDPDGGGDAWYEVGTRLHGDVHSEDGNHQLIGWRLDNTAGDPTPAAGTVGLIRCDGTENKVKVVVSATEFEYVISANNTDYQGQWLPIQAWDWDASNPPTAVTVGTTPTIRGALFDATNETVSIGVPIPSGYSEDANVLVRVICYLNAGETTNDTIDATLDYVTVQPDNGETPTGTSTQATAAESIGSNKDQYDCHQFDFSLAFNDANNPPKGGDLLEMEFALSSVASVTGIIVRGAWLLTPVGTKMTE